MPRQSSQLAAAKEQQMVHMKPPVNVANWRQVLLGEYIDINRTECLDWTADIASHFDL